MGFTSVTPSDTVVFGVITQIYRNMRFSLMMLFFFGLFGLIMSMPEPGLTVVQNIKDQVDSSSDDSDCGVPDCHDLFGAEGVIKETIWEATNNSKQTNSNKLVFISGIHIANNIFNFVKNQHRLRSL